MSTSQNIPKGLPLFQNYVYSGFDKSVMEKLPMALYTCDTDGAITFYNPAAVKLWGRKPIVGAEKWNGAFKTYSVSGEPIERGQKLGDADTGSPKAPAPLELIIERPDGCVSLVMLQILNLYDAEGIILGTVNVLVDTTDDSCGNAVQEMLQKKAEENRKAFVTSEERYHKMIDEVQDYAILLIDRNGMILNWNRGAETIKGYRESEIVGKNFRIFYLETDRKEGLPDRLLEDASVNGRAGHEGWRVRKDGSTFWGSVVITALHDSNNDIIGFSKVTRDLTERKLAEDRLTSNAKAIEFRNKQLEEYAYVASHDLQEPLRKIQVFSEMLLDSIDDKDEVLRYINKIAASADRMTNLIKDVLKYSQVSNTEELFEVTHLNLVLQNVLDDFDLLIDQRKVKLHIGELPILMGVPIQLHQLFSNLLSNAIKFSNAVTAPEISITAHEPTAEDMEGCSPLSNGVPYTKIVFKDNGQGFEQEYADQVFKMFKRLDATQGTGIGLALCKKIAEGHKGCISVKSNPGDGAEFSIFLPLI